MVVVVTTALTTRRRRCWWFRQYSINTLPILMDPNWPPINQSILGHRRTHIRCCVLLLSVYVNGGSFLSHHRQPDMLAHIMKYSIEKFPWKALRTLIDIDSEPLDAAQFVRRPSVRPDSLLPRASVCCPLTVRWIIHDDSHHHHHIAISIISIGPGILEKTLLLVPIHKARRRARWLWPYIAWPICSATDYPCRRIRQ